MRLSDNITSLIFTFLLYLLIYLFYILIGAAATISGRLCAQQSHLPRSAISSMSESWPAWLGFGPATLVMDNWFPPPQRRDVGGAG